jgi:hypothetical protein
MKNKAGLVIMLGIVVLAALAITQPARADDTPTPTETPTPTDTPTSTPTPTSTGTSTATPTPTATWYAGAYIIWASPLVVIDGDMLADIETLLLADPPAEAEGPIYVVTDATSNDGAWDISISNLTDVAPPYEDWNWETNAEWSGGITCTGTDPDWVCDYFDPPDYGGDSSGLIFPWRPGSRAVYGILGVHAGVGGMPGSSAVDFFGGDNMGTSIMPPYIYASENGTVISVCKDDNNIGVIIQGTQKIGYLHLQPSTNIEIGDTFTQGQQIGILRYGTFSLINCGWASQDEDKYHIHYSFYPSGGYFLIGGCQLNTTTGYWLCGSSSVGKLSMLTNGGSSSTGTTGTSGSSTTTVLGGEHIWDGIVTAIVNLAANTTTQYLPEQDSRVGFFISQARVIVMLIFDILDIYVFGPNSFTTTALVLAIGLMFTMELLILGLDLLFGVLKFGLKIWGLIIP